MHRPCSPTSTATTTSSLARSPPCPKPSATSVPSRSGTWKRPRPAGPTSSKPIAAPPPRPPPPSKRVERHRSTRWETRPSFVSRPTNRRSGRPGIDQREFPYHRSVGCCGWRVSPCARRRCRQSAHRGSRPDARLPVAARRSWRMPRRRPDRRAAPGRPNPLRGRASKPPPGPSAGARRPGSAGRTGSRTW